MVFPNGTLALRPEGELGLNRVIGCVPPFFLQPTRSLGWHSQSMGRSSLKVEFKVESFVLQCLVTTSSSYSTAGHYFPTLPVPHTSTCSDQDGSLQEDPRLMLHTHRASPVTLPAPSASSSSNLHLISFQIPSSSGHWARELTYSSWETWMTLYYYTRCSSQAETVQTPTTRNGVRGFSTVDQVPRQALSHGPRG